MSQPPEDEGPSIVEPPFDPETDTRPLKPLRRPQPPGAVPLPRRIRRPPATILREAIPPPSPIELPRPQAPTTDDTDRVRLVPRLPEPPAWRIILTTLARKPSTIGLDVRERLVIGRLDPGGEAAPDLDLSPHLALEHGISRQHAVLLPTGDALYIVDLDSTNGTWVNGEYLQPGQRHALQPGDRLELGLLRLVVKSVTMVSRQSS